MKKQDTKPVEILMAGRDIIKDERNWCKRAYARSESGMATTSSDGNAVQFCLIGSINRASHKLIGQDFLVSDVYTDALTSVECTLFDNDFAGILEFNDDHDTTHDCVMDVYNKSISRQLSLENKKG